MSKIEETPLMDIHSLNYIQSLLKDIREQLFDYSSRLNMIDMGTGQGIRDQVSVFSAQLADMYGDIVTDHELAKAEYARYLRERHLELWKIFQMDNEELNPEGKISKSDAKDKARYQSVIDAHPISVRMAKLKGLEERCNGLWRYTVPKFLDSIASRIALTKEFPQGLPSTALAMSQRSKSGFSEIFSDLTEQSKQADQILDEIKVEYLEDLAGDNGFSDPNL